MGRTQKKTIIFSGAAALFVMWVLFKPLIQCLGEKVRERHFGHAILEAKNDYFYQDRLGTNIGKAEKRVPRFLIERGRVRAFC